jgi:hypothetical protein
MKKSIIIIPDETINLPHGDKVEIYVKKDKLEFNIFSDGSGFNFELPASKIIGWIKK